MLRSVPTIVVLCFLVVLAASSSSVSGQDCTAARVIPPLTLQNRTWETRGLALVISFLAFIPHARLATENGQRSCGFPYSFFGFLRNLELI